MMKIVIIPYEIKTLEKASKLFLKLLNMNFDISIDTNFNSDLDNIIKYYDKSYKKIIVFENYYALLDGDSEKIISIDEIINLAEE